MFTTKNLEFMNFIKYEDVNIKKAKVNFIVGKSGCGKSTLLKLFNKTQSFSQGDIIFNGKSISSYDSIVLRKQVRLISQTPFLFKGTIRENFKLFYDYCEEKLISDEQMIYYLKLVQADFSPESVCDTLSGGEKQRVYIAICLSFNSEVVMLDEPTSALDFDLSCKVLENIIDLAKATGKTLIIISHDATLVEKYAQNIIDLNGGNKNG